MKDGKLTREQLVSQAAALRRRIAKLEKSLAGTGKGMVSADTFRLIAERANDGIIIIRGNERLYFNPKYLEMTGYGDPAELADKPPLSFIHPEDLDKVVRIAKSRQETGSAPAQYEFRGIRADGSVIWVEISSSLIDYEGQPASLGYMRDITERKKAEEALMESEERFRQLADATFEGILIHDKGRILDVNQSTLQMLGYEREEFAGRSVLDFIADESREIVMKNLRNPYDAPFEIVAIMKDGSALNMEVFGKPIVFRMKQARVVALRDITRRKQMEDEIRKMAITDDLTGLNNRRGFLALAQQQMSVAERTKRGLVLMVSDLDGMKRINDTWGHLEGDKILIEAAAVLTRVFRAADIIARTGGDEFAVLALKTSDTDPGILIDRLQKQINENNQRQGRLYDLSMSIGFAEYHPGRVCSIDELIQQADMKMYEHKRIKEKQ